MLTKTLKTTLAVSIMIGGMSFAGGAFAAGDSTTSTPTPSCDTGKIWDKKKRQCVKAEQSGQLDDNNLYEAARDLAYNKRYDEAIHVLSLAKNQDDPRILNYLGYSHRKLGQIEKGLTYYQAALKEDPDYTLVMEYMGEAFLQLGQVDKARQQLAEIEKRCGTGCREYTMLETEINRYAAQ